MIEFKKPEFSKASKEKGKGKSGGGKSEKATIKAKAKEAVLARSKDKKKDGEPIKSFNCGPHSSFSIIYDAHLFKKRRKECKAQRICGTGGYS